MKHEIGITILLLFFVFFTGLVSAGDIGSVSLDLVGAYSTSRNAHAVFVDNDTAYVANGGDGLVILDVSTSFNPRKIGQYKLEDAEDVTVANNIAYVIQRGILEGTRHLRDRVVLIDVSDPWNPIKRGEYNHTGDSFGGIDVVGNKIYLTASEKLIILDARDLWKPIKAGEFEFGKSNLAYPNIDVVGDIAYIAWGSGGLHIISVRNSSQPVEIGGFDTAGWATNVAVAENIAYVTKWEEGLAVLNVRDPTSPVKIGQYRSGDILLDVSVNGDIAYVTYTVRSEGDVFSGYQPDIDSGLIALDISDPNNPKEIGRYTGMDYATDVFATAGIVYATDKTRGLQVFEVTQVSPPLLKSPESPDIFSGLNWGVIGVVLVVMLLIAVLACLKYRGGVGKKKREPGGTSKEETIGSLPTMKTPVSPLHEEKKKPSKKIVEHDVFISYSSEDKTIADATCANLESKGIRCWIAPRDVLPGKNYQGEIIDAIDNTRIMVLIFSSHSNKSPYIIRELTEAVENDVVIIPFRIENVLPSKSMKFLINVPHWLDAMTPPLEQHLEKLAETIRLFLNNESENGDDKT